MKLYDIECPVCGTLNKNIDIEETNGWMECERCSQVTLNFKIAETENLIQKVPVINSRDEIYYLLPDCPAGLWKNHTHG